MRHRNVPILGLVMAVAMGACKGETPDTAKLDTFPVRVEAAARRDLEEAITLVGSIKARDEATLFSRVPGKLLRNLVREGDPVAKGTPVALVERDEVGVKFEPAPVPSTLTGLVARVYLDRGADVTPATPVALIVNQAQVFARADVPERYAGRIAMKQDVRVRVDAYPDIPFHGNVSRVSPVVDAVTRSTYLEATLENPKNRLRSGMFAKLEIVLAKRDKALSIPVEALVDEGDAAFVARGGKASRRKLAIGLRSDRYVEVTSGLAEGETVVTFGLFGLKEGSRLEILP